jgi:hypothetical protein
MALERPLRFLSYASLVLGGFLVITYLAFCYSAVWQHEFLPIFPENQRQLFAPNNSSSLNETMRRPERFVENPLSIVFSPQAIGLLAIGIFLIANGYLLLKHLHRKETSEVKKFITSSLLTDEEKTFYDELLKCGGEATQKQLSLSTGFSAVKTYRVLKRLEDKKVIKTFPYGMTKKIVLNGDVEKQ